jgi:hypothetical protein
MHLRPTGRRAARLLLGLVLLAVGCDDASGPDLGPGPDLSADPVDLTAPADPWPAVAIFGQTAPTRIADGAAALDGTTFSSPVALARAGGRFLLSDNGNGRIILYDPGTGFQQAAFSLLGNNAIGPAGTLAFRFPLGLASDGTRLAVADWGNDRVLLWQTIPVANFTPAHVVIGQSSAHGDLANRGLATAAATSLSGPSDVTFAGGKLIVADTNNHRVLIYNAVPSASGAPADVVIGQATSSGNAANRGGTVGELGLNGPLGVWSDGTRLLVADTGNHRVLMWESVPTDANAVPKIVLGQASRSSATAATTATGMSSPYSAIIGTAA